MHGFSDFFYEFQSVCKNLNLKNGKRNPRDRMKLMKKKEKRKMDAKHLNEYYSSQKHENW